MRLFHIVTASLITLKFTLSASKLSVVRNALALFQICQNLDTLRLSNTWTKVSPASSTTSTLASRFLQDEKNRLRRCLE
jgi:hypothetical protein